VSSIDRAQPKSLLPFLHQDLSHFHTLYHMADLIELQSVCGVFFMKDATQQKTQIVTEIFRHLACFNKSKFKYL
jgi:hypothetical protein